MEKLEDRKENEPLKKRLACREAVKRSSRRNKIVKE